MPEIIIASYEKKRLDGPDVVVDYYDTGYSVHTITYPDGEVQHDERDEAHSDEVRQWHLNNGFREVTR